MTEPRFTAHPSIDEVNQAIDTLKAFFGDLEHREELLLARAQEIDSAIPLAVQAALDEASNSPQARLGRWLARPGGVVERAVVRAIQARQVSRTLGRREMLRRSMRKIFRGSKPAAPLTDTRLETDGRDAASPSIARQIEHDPIAEVGQQRDLVLRTAAKGVLYEQAWARAHSFATASNHDPSPTYVPYREFEPIESPAVSFLAFYLPQFHPIKENDEWWGRGFTEWTNVTRAVPQFHGHYQPHLPIDLGFYDLRIPEVQERQVELARNYGVTGFCFYHYWFSGSRLLESPLDSFVSNEKIDFPFCLMWANESWSRRWEGNEVDVLMSQSHTLESDEAFIDSIVSYVRHKNYIHVEGRPLIGVYRPQLMANAAETVKAWKRKFAVKGLPEPYFVMAQAFGDMDPRPFGFDASVKFPPHNEHSDPALVLDAIQPDGDLMLNPEFTGRIFSYPKLVRSKMTHKIADEYAEFDTVSPGWDNTARRPNQGLSYHLATPEYYYKWLVAAARRALTRKLPIAPIVFINAWNEWAEGAHLEPDRKFGYGYLDATRRAGEVANYMALGKKDVFARYRDLEDPYGDDFNHASK